MSSSSMFSTANTAAFRKVLLLWYDSAKRDLPWRQTKDPYRVWISEIMLQQTRVAAVVAYYRRFLERFPTLKHLAEAPEQDVLAAWSGLGYYRRVRMMHAAAKEIMERHAGRFPRTAAGLLELPGIGRYTSAAIASIAFNEPIAVVDGNVERVLSRTLGISSDDNKGHWQAAQRLVDSVRPGDFNQGIMELGATICLPKIPKCLICPVRRWCRTRGEHEVSKPEARNRRQIAYLLAGDRNRVLLQQRPASSALMPMMWELPVATKVAEQNVVLKVRHSITNTDYDVLVLRSRRRKVLSGQKWIMVDSLPQIPLTGLTLKILRGLEII